MSTAEILWDAAQALAPRLSAEWWARAYLERPSRHPARSWEQGFAEAASPVDAMDRFRGWAWGSITAPKVLLVHGFGGRSTQMGAFGHRLAEMGLCGLAFDGPAHGMSRGRRTDPFDFTEALLGIGREWGPFEAIIAHSFGAGCALYAVSRGLPVKRMALLAGPRSAERFIEAAPLRPSVRRWLIRRYQRRYGDAAERAVDLSSIHRPALIVHDEADPYVPFVDALSLAEALPRSRLERLQGVGHFAMLKKPSVVDQVARFAAGA
ncbi:MAG: alpha/beta hydrolase [Myxococcota bacterium]